MPLGSIIPTALLTSSGEQRHPKVIYFAICNHHFPPSSSTQGWTPLHLAPFIFTVPLPGLFNPTWEYVLQPKTIKIFFWNIQASSFHQSNSKVLKLLSKSRVDCNTRIRRDRSQISRNVLKIDLGIWMIPSGIFYFLYYIIYFIILTICQVQRTSLSYTQGKGMVCHEELLPGETFRGSVGKRLTRYMGTMISFSAREDIAEKESPQLLHCHSWYPQMAPNCLSSA